MIWKKVLSTFTINVVKTDKKPILGKAMNYHMWNDARGISRHFEVDSDESAKNEAKRILQEELFPGQGRGRAIVNLEGGTLPPDTQVDNL